MSRVQLALRVSDLQRSINFYRSLFGVEPAKRRPGYANFTILLLIYAADHLRLLDPIPISACWPRAYKT